MIKPQAFIAATALMAVPSMVLAHEAGGIPHAHLIGEAGVLAVASVVLAVAVVAGILMRRSNRTDD